MIREIVTIDEELCDGCGLCVPSCQEGALRIVDGKARLVADKYCDGMGACLGHCPRGAIKIEQREAEGFDESAVEQHLASDSEIGHACPTPTSILTDRRNGMGHPAGCPTPQREPHGLSAVAPQAHHAHRHGGGCPGSRFAQFERGIDRQPSSSSDFNRVKTDSAQPSELTHWPVQLRLLSPEAPVLARAKLLVAADCVPVAYAGFHRDFLRDHAVVIACPKLDDPGGYIEKLEAMIRNNELQEITVVHMEVPCCRGILSMVFEACQRAEAHVPLNDVVIGIRGEVLSRRQIEVNTDQVTG